MKILNELKKAFSVPLVFHWSTLILLGFFIMNYGLSLGIVYCALIIGSILIHEYAHVWIAQRSGANVAKVVVMALGAAAMIEPTAFIGKFGRELRCAIAGPIASLLLAVMFFFPFIATTPKTVPFAIFLYLFLINLLMFVFNLLPIYPMDGGRIFNAILGMIFSKKRGIVKGGILGVKVSSVVAYVLSGVAFAFSIYFRWYWMVMMFGLLIPFTVVNRKAVIDMYNKYDLGVIDH